MPTRAAKIHVTACYSQGKKVYIQNKMIFAYVEALISYVTSKYFKYYALSIIQKETLNSWKPALENKLLLIKHREQNGFVVNFYMIDTTNVCNIHKPAVRHWDSSKLYD